MNHITRRLPEGAWPSSSGEDFECNTNGEEVGSLSFIRYPFLDPKV